MTKTLQTLLTVLPSLRLSQLKTLAKIVCAAMKNNFLSLAELARSIKSPAKPRHRIKQLARFLANPRIAPYTLQSAVASFIFPDTPLPHIVAVDWTEFRGFMCLVAGRVAHGRAIPFLVTTYQKGAPSLSQNEHEETFFHILKNTLRGKKFVVVCDRGFGYRRLIMLLCRLGIRFVIRVKGATRVRHNGVEAAVKELFSGVGSGICIAEYGGEEIRVVYGRKRGAKEAWYLLTNCSVSAEEALRIYYKRMRIEETFRDLKWAGGVMGMGRLKMRKERNLQMLLSVVMLVYWLLMLLGERIRRLRSVRDWVSGGGGLSDVKLGRYWVREFGWRIDIRRLTDA